MFCTLNPVKIWHERLTHLSPSPVRCSHFILGNPKKSFSNRIIHTYFRYFSEENKSQLLYCKLAVYNLFSASYYLHSLIIASGAHYRRSSCIQYQSAIRTSCSSGLLGRALNFSRAWWCDWPLTSGKKNWKHAFVQKVVTLNNCCDVACLTFSCHTSQPVIFRATYASPQPALFRATNIWRNTANFQWDEKFCFSQIIVVWPNYELLRWLVEMLSRDVHHYRMISASRLTVYYSIKWYMVTWPCTTVS